MQGRNERQDLTSKEDITKCRMQVWDPDIPILCYIMPIKRLESWNNFVLFLSSSWILWWCSPRTEWYHRVAWVPPRLSQLCQLYMADNNRGEEPNPAHLRHAGAGGRLWYCISIRWSAVAWQLKNEVRNEFLIYHLIFLSCSSVALSSLFLFEPHLTFSVRV